MRVAFSNVEGQANAVLQVWPGVNDVSIEVPKDQSSAVASALLQPVSNDPYFISLPDVQTVMVCAGWAKWAVQWHSFILKTPSGKSEKPISPSQVHTRFQKLPKGELAAHFFCFGGEGLFQT